MRYLTCLLGITTASFCLAQRGPTVVMPAEDVIEGITFDSVKNAVFIPIDELESELGLSTDWDSKAKAFIIGTQKVSGKDVRELFDGTPIVNILALKDKQVSIIWKDETKDYEVSTQSHFGVITVPSQWVEINLSSQRLRAYQGNRLIMETKVSSGKRGNSTPTGSFTTGPEKSRHRTSSKYENAPMPYSVQFYGGYFIHGSSSVPNYPASHGCIRMPLTGMNAAKFFFEWVNLKVPVTLNYGWSAKVKELDASD